MCWSPSTLQAVQVVVVDISGIRFHTGMDHQHFVDDHTSRMEDTKQVQEVGIFDRGDQRLPIGTDYFQEGSCLTMLQRD